MINIETALCPTCGWLPEIVMGPLGFCGNIKCKTVSWDMTQTLDHLLTHVSFVKTNDND